MRRGSSWEKATSSAESIRPGILACTRVRTMSSRASSSRSTSTSHCGSCRSHSWRDNQSPSNTFLHLKVLLYIWPKSRRSSGVWRRWRTSAISTARIHGCLARGFAASTRPQLTTKAVIKNMSLNLLSKLLEGGAHVKYTEKSETSI